jgi:hypothetical protein
MQFNESTPRASVTINGSQFTVPQPFAEGHVCSTGEASSLNQTLKENARNNLAPKADLTQEQVDAYVQAYEFGAIRSGGARVTDPVERKARQIAKNAIEAKLREKGVTMDKETLATRVTELASRPQIRKEAERQVKAEQTAASAGLEDLDLSGAEPQPQAEAA